MYGMSSRSPDSDKFLEDLDELGLQTHLPSTRMMGLSEQH